MSLLFKEYVLKQTRVLNRIVMPPMVCFGWSRDGSVTELHREHYSKRANNDVGMIITEALCIDENARLDISQLGIWKDDQISGLSNLADDIKKEGCIALAQIHHAGMKTHPEVSNDIIAPSKQNDLNAREITKDEIFKVKEAFLNAVCRAEKAGFDGIELHGAHGYLLSQFASPITNKRTDHYGGNVTSRMRFAQEIIDDIKRSVKSSFIIGYRMGGNEPDISEGVKIAKILESSGIDYIHVSYGISQGKPEKPKSFPFSEPVYYASQIKKAVNTPVIAVNGIRTPSTAQQILEAGYADFTAIGRGLLSDPYWAKNAKHNVPVNPCLNCSRCFWFKDGSLCPAKKKFK